MTVATSVHTTRPQPGGQPPANTKLLRAFGFAAPFFICAASLYLARRDPTLFHALVRENAVVENLQALLFAASALVAVCVAWLLARSDARGWAVVYALAALGLFLVCGEETNWGQRVFGFPTPEHMKPINLQREFNLHNMRSIRPYILYGTVAISISATALSLIGFLFLRRRYFQARRYLWIPHPTLIPGMVTMLGYLWFRAHYYQYFATVFHWSTVSKLQEAVELIEALTVFIFLLTALLCERAYRANKRPPDTLIATEQTGFP